MTPIFVTGTGTDIGKTYVTAGLIRALRANKRTVSALKPVMSGFEPSKAESNDAGVLLAALGGGATIESISPWRFAAPLSPDMAAAREGRRIDFRELLEFCLPPPGDGVHLVEGVGGVMVPLGECHTVLDWMEALGWQVLIVGGTYLGAISHTLTAVDAVARRGLTVLALVVNETEGGVDMRATVATLRRFVTIPIHVLLRDACYDQFNDLASLFLGMD